MKKKRRSRRGRRGGGEGGGSGYEKFIREKNDIRKNVRVSEKLVLPAAFSLFKSSVGLFFPPSGGILLYQEEKKKGEGVTMIFANGASGGEK